MGHCFSKKKKDSPGIELIIPIKLLESELTRQVNVVVIGHNTSGDLGLRCINEVNELTVLSTLPDFDFTEDIKIYSSDMSTFYAINNKYYYATGSNFKGQLGINSTAIFHSTPTPITFFHDHDMRIKQLCSNCCTNTVFWITENNRVYANGNNDHRQTGIMTNNDQNEFLCNPHRTLSFKKNVWIIDVQSTCTKSIALFGASQAAMMIIDHWIRTLKTSDSYYEEDQDGFEEEEFELFTIIPEDIVALLIQFHGFEANKLYSTQNDVGNLWREILGFEYINITKIRAGLDHFLCLSTVGEVYDVCESEPKVIEYFKNEGIKVEDVECGAGYNLVFDQDGNVYSWGDNEYGQCGRGSKYDCMSIGLIFPKQKYVIIEIDCGYDHSYCKTKDGLHFLFGGNEYNQCITYDGQIKCMTPFCINDILVQSIGKKEVMGIYLGYKSTKLVVRG